MCRNVEKRVKEISNTHTHSGCGWGWWARHRRSVPLTAAAVTEREREVGGKGGVWKKNWLKVKNTLSSFF